LEIKGDEIRSGDQLVIMDRADGPKKFIEKHGYRLDVTVPYTPDYRFQYERDQIKTEYIQLSTGVKKNGDLLSEMTFDAMALGHDDPEKE